MNFISAFLLPLLIGIPFGVQKTLPVVNSGLNPTVGAALSPTTRSEFRSEFFRLCDSAIVTIKDNNGKRPFFIDSYDVRGLCAAYDMTGNKRYFDACRAWADKMVGYQKKMIPSSAYYIDYGRKPGQKKGDWYVADCSSIAMGVLSTAIRCKGAEREKLLRSVKEFASLVLKKFVRPSGGVTDGFWPQYDGAWWCSSSLFGSFSFMLYRNTGNNRYLDAALGIVDWLNKQDLATTQPLPLSHQGPSLPMYVLECYSAGLPYWSKSAARKDSALAQIRWCLNWAKKQEETPVAKRHWPLLSWWGAKYGGLPFQDYVYANYLPHHKSLLARGDLEMRLLVPGALSGKPGAPQLDAFMMMSYAQRLDPGAIYR